MDIPITDRRQGEIAITLTDPAEYEDPLHLKPFWPLP